MNGFAAIGLDRIKDKANLGGALRAAGCFNAQLVVVSGARMGKYATDTMKAYKHVPCIQTENLLSCIPYGAMPVAVEINSRARDLRNFVHPKQAFYIFGPEDGSIKEEILNRVPVIVQIPSLRCLNLAAAVNVVLYDRVQKQL